MRLQYGDADDDDDDDNIVRAALLMLHALMMMTTRDLQIRISITASHNHCASRIHRICKYYTLIYLFFSLYIYISLPFVSASARCMEEWHKRLCARARFYVLQQRTSCLCCLILWWLPFMYKSSPTRDIVENKACCCAAADGEDIYMLGAVKKQS